MDIRLKNTLGKQKEVFKPLQGGKVKMYNCGPTVYDYAHLGNLRAYIFSDLLRRTLEYNDYKVEQIINITDIGHLTSDADEGEDKMAKGLKREGKEVTLESMKELANFYTDAFVADLGKLNIKLPHHMPFASDTIEADIEIIKKLEEKDFIYKTSDGIYFDTARDKNYGRLGQLTRAETAESRIGKNKEKKNDADFALWKFNNELGFDSPWGQGFPGWHIECSGMVRKFLGETIDIHTGGVEHIPIHHNNEITQSENANGKVLANYWLHNEWLQMGGEKVAKSTGNVVYLRDLEANNNDPLAYRYLLLQAHYSSPVNFSQDALDAAQTALTKLRVAFSTLPSAFGSISEDYKQKFLGFINNDLDTPQALALVWELLKDDSVKPEDKGVTLLDFDKVLGLKIDEVPEVIEMPGEVKKLLEEREQARKEKDWKKADKLREEIIAAGFEVRDE